MVAHAAHFDSPHRLHKRVSDRPQDWLGTTPLLDLDDSKLRLKARSLVQLCRTDRDKALAIYRFVKRMPYTKRIKMQYPTARDVLEARAGDGDDKATLLIALMRSAGIPARLRYMEMRGEMLRGLVPRSTLAARPLAEFWLGHWVRTDTYIFDTGYVAAARQRLKDHDWEWGYGIHRNGQSIWNGTDDAFLGGYRTEQDPMVVRTLGVYHDPLQFVTTDEFRRNFVSAAGLRWNLQSLLMRKAVRQLRTEGDPHSPASHVRKSS